MKLMPKYIAQASVHIQTGADKVWDALINPAIIKKYFHDTEAISDWKKGSSLEFRGIWKGKPYVDKGVIMEIEKEKLLKYSWLSSLSGLEDKEENYSVISYRIHPAGDGTDLSVTQENIPSEEGKKASEKNWGMTLQGIKSLLENQAG
jgi:uncharacterized protein YndB with AHSA1/START domain